MKTAVVYQTKKPRSQSLAIAAANGFASVGIRADVRSYEEYTQPDSDIVAFYGFPEPLRKIYSEYLVAGKKTVFFDLGYFGRSEGLRYQGYHRIAINALHATKYFQDVSHDDTRVRPFKLKLGKHKPPTGASILLCGQSAKAAGVYGLQAEEWETKAAERLRDRTERKIVYRPKPSWVGAGTIPGTRLGSAQTDIRRELQQAHAVIAHHSNVGVDAVIEGCPVFLEDGLARVMNAGALFDDIEKPKAFSDEARWQFLCDAAYTQWTVPEIASGAAWRHMLLEELL